MSRTAVCAAAHEAVAGIADGATIQTHLLLNFRLWGCGALSVPPEAAKVAM